MAPQFIFEMRNVSKAFGEKVVLRNINLSFYYGAKIGVVGENGSGKSTLLRIMAGLDRDIDGTATLAKGMRVRYVAQEPHLDLDKTVRDNLRTAMKPVQDLIDRFNAVSARMAEPGEGDDMDKLIEEMGQLQEKIEACDGWELDRMLDIASDALVLPPDDAPVRPAFRRRAAARGLVHGFVGEARPAVAGRADQPPRRGNRAVAGANAAGISRHGHHRHPRPLLPRQHHEVDPGAGRRPRNALRGQLLVLGGPEGSSCCGSRKRRRASGRRPSSASWTGFATRTKAGCKRTRPGSRPTTSWPATAKSTRRARRSSRSPPVRGWATRC